ncbi:acyl-CoA thioesterase [Candidatus Fermentibacteria bacterium]|nr:MAG: acyl-CoA thioesterase [Candidatus Fermentibacteria bacterium]
MAELKEILIDDKNCFACGPENPVGLKLKFHLEEGSGHAVCETVIADHFSGWKGAAHGGIITTLLDETMVYACSTTGWFTVTGTIEVRFHKPVPTGVPLFIKGKVTENRGRSIKTSGTIEVDNQVLASAAAVLIPVKKIPDMLEAIGDRLAE